MPDGTSGALDGFGQGEPDFLAAVLVRFRQGDPGAFESLFRRHQRSVYSWILRMVRNPSAAEDLTVESFWRMYRAHARFDPAREFGPWARRIATRAALDWLRARRPEAELPAGLCEPQRADPAVRAEIRSKVARAFSRLPAQLRAAAALAVIEEQPQRQIASALGISVAAVKLRVFRAMRLLRKDLEQQGMRP